MRYSFWSLCMLLLAGCAAFSSCSEDTVMEDGRPENATDRQAIRFSYVTSSVTRGTNLDVQGDALSPGLQTGIYVRAALAEDCASNVEAVANGAGRLTVQSDIYYPEDPEERVSAYAYAPYQADWGAGEDATGEWNVKTFTVQTDQRTDEAVVNSDLLWAEPTGETTNPFRTESAVVFGFRHLLTKVVVTLDIDKLSVTRLGTIKVEMLGVKTSCTFDLLTGVVGNPSLPQDVIVADMELAASDMTGSDATVTKTCCAIVVPQTVEPGATLFRVTMPDGTVRVANQPVSLRTEYKGGQTFNYGLSLSEMVVLDDITESEEVDLGLSVIWANHNVGAENPEDYGGLYGWADPTGVLVTTNDDSYPSADPPTEISGTEYDIARAQWGGTWRLPTLAHFNELLYQCTWTRGTYKGVWGYKVTGPNGNSIFLPAGGCRMGLTTQLVGTGGCYWSGTLDTNSSTGKKAIRMAFMAGDRLLFSYDRYVGHSVRPVKDKE